MYIKVCVTAGAKKEKFEQISDDHFEISVREEARQNLANRRVTELLKRHFTKARGNVRIVSGHHSPSKIFSVET